ncbi:DUF4221 family protein [Algoriphagus pacificus]|uniref:DUF4221 family protein n=1 Tax=Algoriphagus pacificus TaxID=2811234 RepID=A0ABS3CB53_9BACT|nr:DUF4221 family protein [Algoriphagus pacificus]MBN7814332.1 DUF4221 family protein [Algoriphagus pacificus]
MKKLLPLFSIIIITACSENGNSASDNILENLTYSIDTLLVDTGDEIIDIGQGARLSSISKDSKKYFYYDLKKATISEIDLQTLELSDIYQFSKEGPNSIGFSPPRIQPLSNNRFFFASSANVGIYSNTGEKEKSLKFNFKEIEGLDIDEGGIISYKVQISPDEKTLYALTNPYQTDSDVRLMIIDPDSKTGRSISLPSMIPTLKLRVEFQKDGDFKGRGEGVSMEFLNDKLFITSSANSNSYIYDYQTDSLHLIEFPHQLVATQKTAEVKNKVEDIDEFFAETEKFKYQVGFGEFLWDKQRQQYFRFGYQLIPNEDPKLEKKSDIFLFAYYENLNLIGETQLNNVEYRFEAPFFKDGKLWSYVNVEDELGFAIFTFGF